MLTNFTKFRLIKFSNNSILNYSTNKVGEIIIGKSLGKQEKGSKKEVSQAEAMNVDATFVVLKTRQLTHNGNFLIIVLQLFQLGSNELGN